MTRNDAANDCVTLGSISIASDSAGSMSIGYLRLFGELESTGTQDYSDPGPRGKLERCLGLPVSGRP